MINDIKPMFDKIICHTQGLNEVHTEALFETWEHAKRKFINAFNGELIWRSKEPVTFSLDFNARNAKVDEFISYVADFNELLGEFIYQNKKSFFENKVENNDITYYDEKLGWKKVPKGMKLTRAFRFFEKNDRVLDNFQTKASMILQEDKVSGYLYLSVHPLDFLTLSENNSGWRSCHALDGEYRCGNLSYMCDESTVICYLASDEKVNLPHMPEDFKWYNKKWRTLLFFSERQSNVFAGRQYPFTTDGSLSYMKEAIEETIWKKYLDKDFFKYTTVSGWHNDYITSYKRYDGDEIKFLDKYIPLECGIFKLSDVISDYKTESNHEIMHYNDLLNSSFYLYPYYMYLIDPPLGIHEYTPKWNIGGRVPCVKCGKYETFLSESLMCEDCEEEYGHCDNEDYFVYCEVCGRRIRVDEEDYISTIDGEIYCEDCASELLTCCDNCGEYVHNGEIHYDKETDRFLCDYCYNRGEIYD